jgi:hypothetical protein
MAPFLALYPSTGPNLPNNTFTFPTNTLTIENYGQMRIDHTLSEKDSLFGRYTADNEFLKVPYLSHNLGRRCLELANT